MFNTTTLKEIFNRTDGHCHFCGDGVVFKKYGMKDINNVTGVWEADHIKQKGKGGSKYSENCLPACYKCNRLRWHRNGEEIRELLFLGLIAREEIKKGKNIGKKLLELKKKREAVNEKRRRKL